MMPSTVFVISTNCSDSWESVGSIILNNRGLIFNWKIAFEPITPFQSNCYLSFNFTVFELGILIKKCAPVGAFNIKAVLCSIHRITKFRVNRIEPVNTWVVAWWGILLFLELFDRVQRISSGCQFQLLFTLYLCSFSSSEANINSNWPRFDLNVELQLLRKISWRYICILQHLFVLNKSIVLVCPDSWRFSAWPLWIGYDKEAVFIRSFCHVGHKVLLNTWKATHDLFNHLIAGVVWVDVEDAWRGNSTNSGVHLDGPRFHSEFAYNLWIKVHLKLVYFSSQTIVRKKWVRT